MIGPEEWVGAAIAALSDDGEAGVAVEPLARRLGVTKGSFYHHFPDRDALWAALLETFEAVGTDATIVEMDTIADPHERLRALFQVAWGNPRHLRAQRALLGSRRPDVVACLVRVQGRRRAYLERCYRDLGFSEERAAHLGAASYALFVGAVLLADQPPFDRADTLQAWVESVTDLLLPSP